MSPETHLSILAALAGFVLKASVGFCLCWLISKVVLHPRRKFAVWFAYLFIAGCYWLFSFAAIIPHGSSPLLSAASGPSTQAFIHPHITAFQIHSLWAAPLSVLLRILTCLYLLGLACFLYSAIKKRLHRRWILRFAYAPPDDIEAIFRPLAKSLGAGKAQLLMLSGIYSPATSGWIKPIILLPPICTAHNDHELADMLRHELQHIRRRDSLCTAIASLAQTLLFFHPAAWYARRRLSLEGELACDLAVVGDSPERRATYAQCLLNFARLRVADQVAPWNLDFAGTSSQLKVRVRSILTETRTLPGWMLGLRAAFGVLVLLGFLALAPWLSVAFSLQPSAFAPSVAAPASQSGNVLPHAIVRKTAHNRHAQFVPQSNLPTPTPQTTPESDPPLPASTHSFQPSASDPALRHRGDPTGATTPKLPTGTILLSSDPSSTSANSASRRASVASTITAGASEAIRLASHDHGKDVH